MKYGEVRRGSVDFRVENMTLDEDTVGGAGHGAMVSQMYRSSASFDAGLRPGDIITAVNGKTIDDASQFRRVIADSKIGTTATLHIVRSGRSADLRVPVESSSSTASRRRR
jgi:S1-C subfamily serine protease